MRLLKRGGSGQQSAVGCGGRSLTAGAGDARGPANQVACAATAHSRKTPKPFRPRDAPAKRQSRLKPETPPIPQKCEAVSSRRRLSPQRARPSRNGDVSDPSKLGQSLKHCSSSGRVPGGPSPAPPCTSDVQLPRETRTQSCGLASARRAIHPGATSPSGEAPP